MRHFPLIWGSLAFVTGLVLGGLLNLPWWLWLACSIIFGLLTSAGFCPRIYAKLPWLRTDRLKFLFLILALCSFGGLRQQISRPVLDKTQAAWYTQQDEVTIYGIVDRFPDVRQKYVQLVVQAQKISTPGADGSPVKGLVMAYVPWSAAWQPGDIVALQGRLEIPAESPSFSYRNFLAQKDIHTIIYFPRILQQEPSNARPVYKLLWQVRQSGQNIIHKIYSADRAALLEGILLGNERNITPALDQAFRHTGTAHLIAISGFNISLLAGLITRLFSRTIPRRGLALMLTVITLTGYAILVGAQPPVVRAVIMGSLGLFGRFIGRRSFSINALLFCAAMMLLFEPALLNSVSFQLSFTASLGLVLLADPLTQAFSRFLEKYAPKWESTTLVAVISDYLILTFAAQLATLPVIAYHFHQISLLSLLANFLVLPPQPLILVLGGLSLLLGWLWLPLGQLFAWLNAPLLEFTNRVVLWLGSYSHATVYLERPSILAVLFLYALMIYLAYQAYLPGRQKRQFTPAFWMAGLLIMNLAVWKTVLPWLDNRTHVIISGQADNPAVLIQTAQQQDWAILSAYNSHTGLIELQNWKANSNAALDGLIVLSRALSPQTAEALRTGQPRVVFATPAFLQTRAGSDLYDQTLQQNLEWFPLLDDQTLQLDNQTRVILSPVCQPTCAALISQADFSLLLSAGNPPASVAAWTGSRDDRPTAILLSASDDLAEWQKYFPEPSLLWITPQLMLTSPDRQILSLPARGWVDLTTDGRQLWLTTLR